MCEISQNLKLCTCNDGSEAENYWVLYRYHKDKNMMIVGEIMLPEFFSETDYKNQELLLSLLNEGQCFDFEYIPQTKDRLLIRLTKPTNKQEVSHGFEYNKGKWNVEEYDVFDWEMKYDEILEGKIENPFHN